MRRLHLPKPWADGDPLRQAAVFLSEQLLAWLRALCLVLLKRQMAGVGSLSFEKLVRKAAPVICNKEAWPTQTEAWLTQREAVVWEMTG